MQRAPNTFTWPLRYTNARTVYRCSYSMYVGYIEFRWSQWRRRDIVPPIALYPPLAIQPYAFATYLSTHSPHPWATLPLLARIDTDTANVSRGVRAIQSLSANPPWSARIPSSISHLPNLFRQPLLAIPSLHPRSLFFLPRLWSPSLLFPFPSRFTSFYVWYFWSSSLSSATIISTDVIHRCIYNVGCR